VAALRVANTQSSATVLRGIRSVPLCISCLAYPAVLLVNTLSRRLVQRSPVISLPCSRRSRRAVGRPVVQRIGPRHGSRRQISHSHFNGIRSFDACGRSPSRNVAGNLFRSGPGRFRSNRPDRLSLLPSRRAARYAHLRAGLFRNLVVHSNLRTLPMRGIQALGVYVIAQYFAPEMIAAGQNCQKARYESIRTVKERRQCKRSGRRPPGVFRRAPLFRRRG
jgi:hypothetical protein